MAEELLERVRLAWRPTKVALRDRILSDPDEGDAEGRRVDGKASEGRGVVEWLASREHRCSQRRTLVPERSGREEERLDLVLSQLSKRELGDERYEGGSGGEGEGEELEGVEGIGIS